MRVTLKQGADLTQVKAKPRVCSPEKSAWLKKPFELLCETEMVYPNLQAICASVEMAFPKGPGKGYVKNGKRGACEQKAATVLPNRTAAA